MLYESLVVRQTHERRYVVIQASQTSYGRANDKTKDHFEGVMPVTDIEFELLGSKIGEILKSGYAYQFAPKIRDIEPVTYRLAA